jgi:membrane protease YdiL (CAAX protease family)
VSDAIVWPPVGRVLAVATATTTVVTVLSLGAKLLAIDEYANLLVAASFLGATWFAVLRSDTATVRAYGLSLGGFFEPEPIDWRRVAREAASSLFWLLVFAAIIFPPFAVGYGHVWAPDRPFALRVPGDWLDRIAGQILVIALPEEAFFRGYLQSALEGRWGARWRILGADLGPGWLIASAIFAVGHVLTIPNPLRLAVFFPALLFGWLRARTHGIGAGVLFHAACNLLSSGLELGYGLRGS